jgi:hypothetical protein
LHFVSVPDSDDGIVPTVAVEIGQLGITRFSIHVEPFDQSHVERGAGGETSPRFE